MAELPWSGLAGEERAGARGVDRRGESRDREGAMMLGTMLFAVAGYVLDARGAVVLHRRSASQGSPATAGSEVHLGDTIGVKANAKALILCPDLRTTWEPAPQSSSGVFEGCPRTSEWVSSRQG